MATIKDIAGKAGVTDMTVSRVLSGRYVAKRPDAIRRAERIRQIASDLGYRPNAAARAQRKGRFDQIAVLSRHEISSPLQLELLKGVMDGAREHELHTVCAEIEFENLTNAEQAPRVLRELCVDGVIVHYAWSIRQEALEIIRGYEMPTIWVNTKATHDAVYPDDYRAARDAVMMLHRAGHRRIGYACELLGDFDGQHYSFADRRAGYLDAMRGLRLPPTLVLAKALNLETFEQRVDYWRHQLTEHADVTAWVAYHDRVSYGLLVSAKALGLCVPDDLSLIGFNNGVNVYETGQLFSRLTVPMSRIGVEAVEMLLALREGGRPHPARAVPYAPPEPISICSPRRC